MRAAVIFGLGSYERDLRPFQQNVDATWVTGLPTSSSDVDAILIFGGDGTVHRHLPQLVRLQIPVLVVPCGSGNDFARALGFKRVQDSLNAWQTFSTSGENMRAVDLGVITPGGPSAAGGVNRYFCCVGGIGLDAEVARRANQLPRWLRGHGGYVASLPGAVFSYAPFPIRISIPVADSNRFSISSDKPAILAAFANTQSYGDGMRIAPNALFDDGLLDICVISDLNKFKLLCLFPTVYFGKHLQMPEVEYFRSDRLRLETEKPFPVYADGEYVCETPIDVSVAKAALKVIVPLARN